MTVRRLLEEVDSSELNEWLAFAQLEPFGCEADDYRAGVMPAITANSNRRPGSQEIRPRDFYPWARDPDA